MYGQFRQSAARPAALTYLAEYANWTDLDDRNQNQECECNS
jgi:hypothetical protein